MKRDRSEWGLNYRALRPSVAQREREREERVGEREELDVQSLYKKNYCVSLEIHSGNRICSLSFKACNRMLHH